MVKCARRPAAKQRLNATTVFTMTAPTAASKPPRGVRVAVGLLGVGVAYGLFEETRPFTIGGLIVAALAAVGLGLVAYGLLRRYRIAWQFANVMGLFTALAGVLQLAGALAGRVPVATYPPTRSLGLIAYGACLALSLAASGPRRWFRNLAASDDVGE